MGFHNARLYIKVSNMVAHYLVSLLKYSDAKLSLEHSEIVLWVTHYRSMFPIIYKPVNCFAEQLNWQVSIWRGTLVANGLSSCKQLYHLCVLRLSGDRSFSTYAKYFEKPTFLTPWYSPVCVRISGLEEWIFSENFAYVLNG